MGKETHPSESSLSKRWQVSDMVSVEWRLWELAETLEELFQEVAELWSVVEWQGGILEGVMVRD